MKSAGNSYLPAHNAPLTDYVIFGLCERGKFYSQINFFCCE